MRRPRRRLRPAARGRAARLRTVGAAHHDRPEGGARSAYLGSVSEVQGARERSGSLRTGSCFTGPVPPTARVQPAPQQTCPTGSGRLS
jgi:hypothetical protein